MLRTSCLRNCAVQNDRKDDLAQAHLHSIFVQQMGTQLDDPVQDLIDNAKREP
jgi:hypothetical protein